MVEFHLDLDGTGAEFSAGHCWLPKQIGPVIEAILHGIAADGSGEKRPVDAERDDRAWRADPSDGLRPTRALRKSWTP
jgi:N-acetylneuraminate synthase